MNQINWCCRDCGKNAKGSYPATGTSTYHAGRCDVCGLKAHITEVRDFGFPDFSELKKKSYKLQLETWGYAEFDKESTINIIKNDKHILTLDPSDLKEIMKLYKKLQ